MFQKIDEIDEMARAMCFRREHCDVESCTEVNCETTWLASNLYNEGYRKQPTWISVKDRLPAHNQEVLVYRKHHSGLISVYTYLIDNKWEDDYGYWSTTKDEGITHWMPLPTPPTEKEN